MPKPLSLLRFLGIALTSLSTLAMTETSYAAGRIFFDDFESGISNSWTQDGAHNFCQRVTVADDKIVGPRTGTGMLRCNSDGSVQSVAPTSIENLVLDTSNYTNELFVRVWVRIDTNHDKTQNSAKKLLRFFVPPLDMYHVVRNDPGLSVEVLVGGKNLPTYFGGAPGDNSASVSAWHRVEYYIMQSGTIKVWHDGILVRNDTGLNFAGDRWHRLFITSNWSDGHDNLNALYFDDFEVFSDNGTGASGLMSNATIVHGTGVTPPPPQKLRTTP